MSETTSEPIWSRHLARELAGILGFPMPETAPDGKDEKLRKEGEQLVADITDQFRYLPFEQMNWAFDLATFLRERQLVEDKGVRPYGWPVAKLREMRDYVAFLRSRHGTAQPADEKDYWTEEDEQDLTAESLRVWDEREAAGE
jgi:hypothetical protein